MMVNKYLTTVMLEFNAFSRLFSIALFIYHGRWPCNLCQGQNIQGQGHKLMAKAKKFGIKAKD